MLPSTMRRLGEQIYGLRSAAQQKSSCSADFCLPGDQSSDGGQFFHSSDVNIRFLSTLIILRTINQGNYNYNYKVSLFSKLFSEESCSVVGLSEQMSFQLGSQLLATDVRRE